jgi:perosamine synthetase
MTQRIPLSAPEITGAEIAAVTAVLNTNSLSLGPKLEEFEAVFAAYHHMPHAVAVSSGTAALHLAMIALGIGENDEVIVPSFTFIAVANAVRYQRATPVFVDIDPLTLNLDPVQVEAAVTARTRAIIIVHSFGVPAEMDALMNLARRHNLAVVEDACEAIGASYRDQTVGTFADISIFAFYPNKQMTTGEGGAILARDTKLADRIRALRNQGRHPSGDWLQHTELGYNYRLSELACALGIVQLSRLPSMLSSRAQVAAIYHDLLSPLETASFLRRPPLCLPFRDISWFVYVIQLADRSHTNARDRIQHSLQMQGIGCARYFAPIHLQPAYASFPGIEQANLPMTVDVAQRTLALPFFNRLSVEQATEVVRTLANAIEQEAP